MLNDGSPFALDGKWQIVVIVDINGWLMMINDCKSWLMMADDVCKQRVHYGSYHGVTIVIISYGKRWPIMMVHGWLTIGETNNQR